MRQRFTRTQLTVAAVLVVLIGAAVGYRLLSGGESKSTPAESDVPRIAILRSGHGLAFDDAIKGIAVGFESHPADFEIEDAGNDPAEARALAQKLLADKPDVLITLGAAAAQVAADVNAGCPLVVAALSDPFALGLASSDEEHRADLTGVYSSEPVEDTMSLIRQLYPTMTKIAAIYNPADPESAGYLQRARQHAAVQQLLLQEVALSRLPLLDSAGRPLEQARQDEAIIRKVMDAIPADVQLIYLARDWVVLEELDGLTKEAALRNIPVVTNDPATISPGCLAALGDEYVSVGREAARQALSILAGTPPADIPLLAENSVILVLNREVAQKLQYTFPAPIEQRATRIVPAQSGTVPANP